MQCKEIRKRLSEYLDDALSRQERADVEQHLRQCENCRRRLTELEGVVGLLHSLPREDAPHDLAVRILEKSAENDLNRPLGAGLWHRIAGVAAMVAVVIGVVLVLANPQQKMYEDLLQESVQKEVGASPKSVGDSLRERKEESREYGQVSAYRVPATGSRGATAGSGGKRRSLGSELLKVKREEPAASKSMELYVTSKRPWDYIKMLVAGAGRVGASEIVISKVDDEDSSAGLAVVVKLTRDVAGEFARMVQKLAEEQKEESVTDSAREAQDQNVFRQDDESCPVTVRIKILTEDER
jgi:hypothetical protein